MNRKVYTSFLTRHHLHTLNNSPAVGSMLAESEGHPDFNERRTTLLIAGRGTHGKIVTDPDVIDLGPVLVNTIVERDMVVYNPCECDVFYSLQVARKRKRKEFEAEEKERGEDGEEAMPNNVKSRFCQIGRKCTPLV